MRELRGTKFEAPKLKSFLMGTKIDAPPFAFNVWHNFRGEYSHLYNVILGTNFEGRN